MSNDITRDAFEAWHNEIEVFATRYERLNELLPKEALFAAWQAATLAERERCAGLVMEAPASMVALHEDICSGRPLPPTATLQGNPS